MPCRYLRGPSGVEETACPVDTLDRDAIEEAAPPPDGPRIVRRRSGCPPPPPRPGAGLRPGPGIGLSRGEADAGARAQASARARGRGRAAAAAAHDPRPVRRRGGFLDCITI